MKRFSIRIELTTKRMFLLKESSYQENVSTRRILLLANVSNQMNVPTRRMYQSEECSHQMNVLTKRKFLPGECPTRRRFPQGECFHQEIGFYQDREYPLANYFFTKSISTRKRLIKYIFKEKDFCQYFHLEYLSFK